MNGLLDTLHKDYVTKLNLAVIEKAYHFAEHSHEGQVRQSGEPYFVHPCEVATILLSMGMDSDTIAAGLLHDVLEDTDTTLAQLADLFGEEIAQLVDGVTKLGRMQFKNKEEQQAESLRKMFLAMAKDIRVVLIKLADRLHNMRTLQYCPEEQRIEVSRETLEIYAPLAHRLGIFLIKDALENLAFQYLYPKEYEETKTLISTMVKEREAAIRNVIETMREQLQFHHIEAQIDGRPKQLYSIFRKMRDQNKSFDQIYDLTAVRVIVQDVRDCYGVLGIVHTLWKPLPNRFKDYIATPKPNLYQSLHTTLIGENGMFFEMQIRTFDMHRTAEYGIAAHWKYKESRDENNKLDDKLTWLRQILEWQNETSDAQEFMDTLKVNLFSDEVFVYTPQGDIIDLPLGATTIDFAYRIHSAIGNKCVGGKINGRMSPLETPLKTGDIVEVLTSNASRGPSWDWLAIAKTPQARSKIRAYFKKERKEENIEKGKSMLEAAVKAQGIPMQQLAKTEWLESICKRYSFREIEDMYAAMGLGGITTNQVLTRLLDEYKRENKPAVVVEEVEKDELRRILRPGEKSTSQGVIVKGESNMLVRFARCCNPLPQDDIVGFITRGRGVSVHRSDCSNLRDENIDPGRFIEVEWEKDTKSAYQAELHLNVMDRSSLLVDISNITQSMNVKLLGINARVNKNHIVDISLVVEINSKQQLENLIKQFKKMPEMIEVFRVTA